MQTSRRASIKSPNASLFRLPVGGKYSTSASPAPSGCRMIGSGRLGSDVPSCQQTLQDYNGSDSLVAAHRMGVIEGLTLAYNHGRWMRASREKGCHVVMVFIEEADYTGEIGDVTTEAARPIGTIVEDVTGPDRRNGIRRIFLVANVHIGGRSRPGHDRDRNLEFFETTTAYCLVKKGYTVQVNSYGYTKSVQLAIHGHVEVVVQRVICEGLVGSVSSLRGPPF